MNCLASEGFFEHDKFIEDNSDGPDIRLTVIRLPQTDLGRHEVGRTAARHGLRIRIVQSSRDTEVTKFADSILRDKYILRLDVAMQNVLVVHGHDSHDDVSQRAQDLVCPELCT